MVMEANTDRSWQFRQLRSSLETMAAAGSEQPSLFPEPAVTPRALAREFEHCDRAVRSGYESELTASQADALAAIDRKLETMSRDEAEFDADLWTSSALRTSEHWAEVRRLAESALEAFGWRADAAGGEAV
jgi:hypothetical protein